MKDIELEGVIVDELADAMRKTMDFDVLCDVMTRFGWTVVKVEYFSGDDDIAHTWIKLVEWADQNCTGQWKEHLGKWLFEDPKDATMFKLRWA